jgi:hypothetical protein
VRVLGDEVRLTACIRRYACPPDHDDVSARLQKLIYSAEAIRGFDF